MQQGRIFHYVPWVISDYLWAPIAILCILLLAYSAKIECRLCKMFETLRSVTDHLSHRSPRVHLFIHPMSVLKVRCSLSEISKSEETINNFFLSGACVFVKEGDTCQGKEKQNKGTNSWVLLEVGSWGACCLFWVALIGKSWHEQNCEGFSVSSLGAEGADNPLACATSFGSSKRKCCGWLCMRCPWDYVNGSFFRLLFWVLLVFRQPMCARSARPCISALLTWVSSVLGNCCSWYMG